MFRSVRSLNSRIRVTTSSPITCVFVQLGSFTVDETTYLSMEFIRPANSLVSVGQYAEKPS